MAGQAPRAVGAGRRLVLEEQRAAGSTRIRLIECDEAEPRVKLPPGKRYEVVVATVVDSDLEAVAAEAETPAARPSRLCGDGSGNTCVAIIEVE